MRASETYEVTSEGASAKVSKYMNYLGEKEDIMPLGEVEVECKKILDLLNGCDVIKWDGFHGKHPPDVCDGVMFKFEATVNGDTVIRADGSQNFPKGFWDLVKGLDEMIREGDGTHQRPMQ
ncbi:MAG: hypothetical protein IJ856_05120 [Candidatus Methanomethylophilaceae archaeon]|nr:hypothetical protein [Candidatus Methanomethylophilaceae archaeon]